ncbi:MAG: Gfo/Idh/MocA family oxidoreductase [Verrucomicrobiia bacterium]|jgi:predicted dehydrogenase
MNSLSWGILSTGRIAGIFAKQLSRSKTGKLVAVGSRSLATADKFAAEHHVPHHYGSYEAVLTDPDVHAVYIATPHTLHADWCIKAARAGKHILCEKPLTLNHAEALPVIEAARKHGVFLMEAFMYRCHPQTAKLVDLLRKRIIGDVRVIHASFGFHRDFNPEARLFKNALGGGGILDIGCYPVSISRLVAGVAMGKPFAEPVEVKGCGHFTPTGVDSWVVGSLKFPGDILAALAASVEVQQDIVLRVYGSSGRILVPAPFAQINDGATTKIVVQRKGEEPQEIVVESSQPAYAIEADHVAAHIEQRQSPAMSWDDSLGNMKTLDQWRESIGLVYESEKPRK